MTSPDTAHSALIEDHDYEARAEPWTLCKHCGLAQATHSRVPDPYVPTAKPPTRQHL